MINILLAGLGGFIGAAARYIVVTLVPNSYNKLDFPFGTIIVNMIGCLIIGILSGFAEHKDLFTQEIRVFLVIGILGGFTTFSAFSYDTIKLLSDSLILRALANVFIQIAGGVLFVWIGILISKLFN